MGIPAINTGELEQNILKFCKAITYELTISQLFLMCVGNDQGAGKRQPSFQNKSSAKPFMWKVLQVTED